MRFPPRAPLALLTALACAHGPSGGAAARPAEMALVTGSRVPQPVDPETGLPPAMPGLRIYGRDALLLSGRATWGDALHDLEPADYGSGGAVRHPPQ